MNALKSLLLISLLATVIYGCSEETATSNPDKVFKINGVFGLKMGDQGPNLPEGYIDNNKAFDFTPSSAHKNFVSYTYSVTPNTHLIYGIKMESVKELAKSSCKEQRKEMIQETLATLGDTSTLSITEQGNKWKVREGNQREITIDCERALNANSQQLVMIYSDTSLSKLGFVEWSKHQDDITKSQ
jgi:hypothetical protein